VGTQFTGGSVGFLASLQGVFMSAIEIGHICPTCLTVYDTRARSTACNSVPVIAREGVQWGDKILVLRGKYAGRQDFTINASYINSSHVEIYVASAPHIQGTIELALLDFVPLKKRYEFYWSGTTAILAASKLSSAYGAAFYLLNLAKSIHSLANTAAFWLFNHKKQDVSFNEIVQGLLKTPRFVLSKGGELNDVDTLYHIRLIDMINMVDTVYAAINTDRLLSIEGLSDDCLLEKSVIEQCKELALLIKHLSRDRDTRINIGQLELSLQALNTALTTQTALSKNQCSTINPLLQKEIPMSIEMNPSLVAILNANNAEQVASTSSALVDGQIADIIEVFDKLSSAIEATSAILKNPGDFIAWVVNKHGVSLFKVGVTEEEFEQVYRSAPPFNVDVDKKQISLVGQAVYDLIGEMSNGEEVLNFWKAWDSRILAQCVEVSTHPRSIAVKALLRDTPVSSFVDFVLTARLASLQCNVDNPCLDAPYHWSNLLRHDR
jgi:hypothetical protein